MLMPLILATVALVDPAAPTHAEALRQAELLVTQAVRRAAPEYGGAEVAWMDLRLPAGCLPVRARVPSGVTAGATIRVTIHGRQARRSACAATALVGVAQPRRCWRLSRSVQPGSSLEDAVEPGPCGAAGHGLGQQVSVTGLVAATARPEGALLHQADAVPERPAVGKDVPVTLRAAGGGLMLRTSGRVVRCPGTAVCVRTGGGARLAGVWSDGTVVVEQP